MYELHIPTDHEHVQVKPGRRTGLPVIIAVHSTVLGPAVGGLRLKHYERSSDGLLDALRLSQAMTMKAAAIDNRTGGGKAVVPLPLDLTLTEPLREAVLLDVADHVHALDGIYYAAPDVGTGPEDIDVIRRRTRYCGGYSKKAGGAGGTTFGTYIGLETALRSAVRQVLGTDSLSGLRIVIVGLGGVGTLIAQACAAEGATLVLSDIDESRKTLADELGASWLKPEDAMVVGCDVLMPCALGGVLSQDVITRLNTKIICGAANNQLASDELAIALRERNIVYVPDFIANAGGLMYASAIEFQQRSETDAEQHTRSCIARNVALILQQSLSNKKSTLNAALMLANARLASMFRSPT